MDSIYTLDGGTLLALPASHADKLIAQSDGAAALVYLWLLRRGGALDTARCAQELGRTRREVEAAADTLSRLGLLRRGAAGAEVPAREAAASRAHLRPAQELPEYSAQDVARRAEADGAFSALVGEVQRLMGRMLSGADLKILFGIYDYLALPPEVILQLVQYCIDFRAGERMPSMRQIQREAYVWADRELITLDQAEAYIRRRQERGQQVEAYRDELQLRGRALSPSERKYLERWAEWGFGTEAVAEAYDRTVLQTGGLKWPYMNSILSSWHQAGLHTLPEIRAGDRRPEQRAQAGSTPAQGQGAAAPSPQEQERLRRLLEKF